MKTPSKILGVFGGLGPAASAEFLRLLSKDAPAERDQDHPVVYVYSNPQIPDRSSAILGKGKSPEEDLKKGLETLISWGADLLAVPCNTAHFFIDRFRSDLKVPLVHIVEATLLKALSSSKMGAWLMATEGSFKSGIYQRAAEKIGYPLFFPEKKLMDQISSCTFLVKAGEIETAAEVIKNVSIELWSDRNLPLLGACTELPLAYGASGLPSEKFVSSLEALSEKCLDLLYKS